MNPTVLCVDDWELVLDNYVDILSDDYNVVTATNRVDALAYVRDNPVDAVIMDRSLGTEDGIEIIEEMRKMGISVPIAVCSDYRTDTTVMFAEMVGATDYIDKDDYIRFLKEHL